MQQVCNSVLLGFAVDGVYIISILESFLHGLSSCKPAPSTKNSSDGDSAAKIQRRLSEHSSERYRSTLVLNLNTSIRILALRVNYSCLVKTTSRRNLKVDGSLSITVPSTMSTPALSEYWVGF
jgi:hypothetical protein